MSIQNDALKFVTYQEIEVVFTISLTESGVSFVFSHIEVRTQRTFEQSSRAVVRMSTGIYHLEQCQSPGHQRVSAPLWNTESRIRLSQIHHAD